MAGRDPRRGCGRSKECLVKLSTSRGRENAIGYSPHGPGISLVPGGRRLEKKTYLTKSRTKVASGIYACWSKDSSWEDDGIDNIVKSDMGSDVKWNQESVEAMLWKGSLGADGERTWQADNEQLYIGEV